VRKKYKDRINLRKNAIDFIHCQWGKDCEDNGLIDIDSEFFESIAQKLFKDLIKNKNRSKNPFIFRICGQSGSGKTTQLAPSINSVISDNFINISVRMFAKNHPCHSQLLDKFGEGLIREKTNGFALLMLFRIVEILIEYQYNMLFEVTILNLDFEKYLSKLAKKNRYNIHFHILSIPKAKSDSWIEKRKTLSKMEKGRVVLKSSSDFFYNILPITLAKLMNLKIWSGRDKIFLWNGFDFKLLIGGKIYKNKKFMELFEYYRNYDGFNDVDENKLLDARIKWFSEYYGNFNKIPR
jgi:hypothetical protein